MYVCCEVMLINCSLAFRLTGSGLGACGVTGVF